MHVQVLVKLRKAHYISDGLLETSPTGTTWITVVILELIHARSLRPATWYGDVFIRERTESGDSE